MLDACTITRPGATTTDPNTGDVTNAPATTVYAGKCKVKRGGTMSANPEAGERVFTVTSLEIHIPMNAADVKDGDVATLTASKLNLFVAGKQYRVDGFEPDSFDTAARLPVKIL